MSVVQVSRSTHAMGAVIYAAYGRGEDAREENQRAAHMTYFSLDAASTPKAWCAKGLDRVHGAATERKNEAFLITQSFSPEEFSSDSESDVTRVHGAGMELAQKMAPNSPYFVATHTDAKGGHVHNHIVVLNHDYSTRKGAPKTLKHHPSVRKANDAVMKDLGMEITGQDAVHLTPVEAHAVRQGRSIDPAPLDKLTNDNWRYTLREHVMDLVDDPEVETMEDFMSRSLLHNVSVRSRSGRGKNKDKTYLTYALVDDDEVPLKVNNRKCSERASKLGTDFQYEGIQEILREKQQDKEKQQKEAHAALVAAEQQQERIEYEESIAQEEARAAAERKRDADYHRRFATAAALLEEGEAAGGIGDEAGHRRTAGWAKEVRAGLEEAEEGEPTALSGVPGREEGSPRLPGQVLEADGTDSPAAEGAGAGATRPGNHPGGNGSQRHNVSQDVPAGGQLRRNLEGKRGEGLQDGRNDGQEAGENPSAPK